jgi:hypothetical protein
VLKALEKLNLPRESTIYASVTMLSPETLEELLNDRHKVLFVDSEVFGCVSFWLCVSGYSEVT